MIIYELPQATEGLAGGAEYVAEGAGNRAPRAAERSKGRRSGVARGSSLCVAGPLPQR